MPAAGRDDRGAQVAARALAEHYGMTCELDTLPGELDRNFACDGHVVKLHTPSADAGELDLQDAAIEHLAGRCGAVGLPRLRRTRDGAARVTGPEGSVRV